MYEIEIEKIQQLMYDARCAAKYARAHYEEFASRTHSYTLYGPDAYDIGASVPSSIVPPRARRLLKTTRRKNYLVYELNENYEILRTIHMLNYTMVDCTYHHFQLDGVHYAYPFRGSGSSMYNDTIYAIRFAENRPVYYAAVSCNLYFGQFFEYPSPDKMQVSTYRYWPTAKRTMHGYPVDRDAPLGALNSPVQRHFKEETPEYIEFSHWFS